MHLAIIFIATFATLATALGDYLCATMKIDLSYDFGANRAIDIACAGRCGHLKDCVSNMIETENEDCLAYNTLPQFSVVHRATEISECYSCTGPQITYKCECGLTLRNIERKSPGSQVRRINCGATLLSGRIRTQCLADPPNKWVYERAYQFGPVYDCPGQ